MISPRSLAFAAAAVVALPACLARAEAPPIPATQPAALFDPARHMHVSEVKAGMTGYGLTVFHGTTIERFDVEVLAVLKNFNAKSDVVLIRCKGDYLQHTGSIAGMSGSPIYLKDDAGHDRMIGAFAYGWPLTKDPVAGVQPIEYMLQLPALPHPGAEAAPPTTAPSIGTAKPGQTVSPRGHASWSLRDAGMLPLMARGAARRAQVLETTKPDRLTGEGDAPSLQPLATPLMVTGLPPAILNQMGPQFRAAGLSPLQAGGGGAASTGPQGAAPLEPGSVLAVPLLTGDMEMTAIGTATEVLRGSVWGFGHPFNNEGTISLPMGSGTINGIIANLQTSFKLGALTQPRGTLNTDGAVGVAGAIGSPPATVPLELSIDPADGSSRRTYHFNVSRHPKFTALIAAAAFGGAVAGSSELPQYNTVDYDLQLAFSNGRTITLANRAVNSSAGELFADAAVVLQAAAENPFQRVMVSKITGTVKVRPVTQSAQIIDVNLPKSLYHPGDKVSAFVTYQPFHGAETVLPVNLDLPHDLPPGQYQLVISDAHRYFADEQASKQFRFTAENIDDVFNVLKDVAAIREDALFIRLLRHPDGVAIGRTALSNLPSSRREILLASGRSNTTPFVSSNIKIVPTELVMAGSSEFTINVEPLSKVAVSGTHAGKPEPAVAPAPKPDEPKKAPSPAEPSKKDAPPAGG